MEAGLSVTEVMSAASKKWNLLSDSLKAPWVAKADKAKAEYEKTIATYEKSANFRKYIADKEVYDAKRKEKRKASRSTSVGPFKKKMKSASRSKSRSRSRSKSTRVPK